MKQTQHKRLAAAFYLALALLAAVSLLTYWHIRQLIQVNTLAALCAGSLLSLSLLLLIFYCLRRESRPRSQAEEALRRSEEEFRAVVNHMPTIVFKGYLDGSVDFFDNKVEAMTGYPREDFESRRRMWTDLILEEDRQSAKERLFRALETRGSYVREYRINTKERGVIWVQERTLVVFDQDGQADHLSGVFFDITARRRGELKLKESQQALEAVVETAATLMLLTDPEGKILMFNRACEELTGYRREEVLGKTLEELFLPPAWIPVVRQRFAAPWAPEVMAPHENPWITKGGEERLIEWRCTVIPSPKDGRPCILGTGIDVTQRKQAAERLEAERQRLFSLLDGLPAYVYLQAPDHTLRFANRFFREQLGEPEGRPCYELLRGRTEACEVCPPLQVLESNQPQEWEWTAPSGRTYQLYDYPFRDVDGSPLVLEMGIDITARKQAEESLENSLKKLRRTLDGTVKALATVVEMRDPYTAGHQMRVTQLAQAIAAKLGFTDEQMEGLTVMGFLHDIGKIAVPAEILVKPGELTDYEFNLIKNHPRVGYDILKEIEFPWPVAQAILQHHEKLDGSGYPLGLSGRDIILEARILAVADIVEAMASHRPYRAALGIDQALKEVHQGRGVSYDPQVVEVCLHLFTEAGFEFV